MPSSLLYMLFIQQVMCHFKTGPVSALSFKDDYSFAEASYKSEDRNLEEESHFAIVRTENDAGTQPQALSL